MVQIQTDLFRVFLRNAVRRCHATQILLMFGRDPLSAAFVVCRDTTAYGVYQIFDATCELPTRFRLCLVNAKKLLKAIPYSPVIELSFDRENGGRLSVMAGQYVAEVEATEVSAGELMDGDTYNPVPEITALAKKLGYGICEFTGSSGVRFVFCEAEANSVRDFLSVETKHRVTLRRVRPNELVIAGRRAQVYLDLTEVRCEGTTHNDVTFTVPPFPLQRSGELSLAVYPSAVLFRQPHVDLVVWERR